MEQNEPKNKEAQRARETLFRVAYQHQSKLIQIADYKANMNISLGAMIISAIIAIIGYGSVSGKIDNYSSVLLIPIAIVIFSCLLSLIFSIQAARPKLLQNNYTGGPKQKTSLLFFGVIASYSQQEYIEKMKTLLSSESEIFEHMTIDLHNQGVILRRKYNLLRHSYQILMYGFIFSVLIFIGILLNI